MVTLEQTEKFHKNKKIIKRVILSHTQRHEVIHGQKAVNKQLPKHLHRDTRDYDIFSRSPKRDAKETEKALDKRFGFNAFKTVRGVHKGTYKVKSRVDGETYADYTRPERKIPRKRIDGKNYATLNYFKGHILRTLKDKDSKFRHEKDKDTLNRIRIAQKKKRKRR